MMRMSRKSLSRSTPIRARRIPVFELLEDRCLLSAGPTIHLLATPNDTSFGSQWDMTKISAPSAWNTTTGSLKIVVADIDSGIDYNHVDLYKNVWINQAEIPAVQKANILANYDDGDGVITFWDLNSPALQGQWSAATIADSNNDNRIDGRDLLAKAQYGGWADGVDDGNTYFDDLIGWDFVGNDNNPMDDNGHGTHTAGTIGAVGNNSTGVAGVNWQTQIMALKILNASGNGDLFDAADAIKYAAQNGARVSNNSWGFSDSGETVSGSKYGYLYDAINGTQNVLFVAAAGNNGLNNDSHWAKTFPASYNLSNIVSVAATNNKDAKASFSNYGSTTVDLGAPGQNILSTVPNNGYAFYSGTSMATPHVAGAAALLLAKNSGLGTAAVKTAILNGVDVINSMSKTVSKGRLNLNKMLNGVASGSGQGSSSSSDGSTGSSGSNGSGRQRNRADHLSTFDGSTPVDQVTLTLADLQVVTGFRFTFEGASVTPIFIQSTPHTTQPPIERTQPIFTLGHGGESSQESDVGQPANENRPNQQPAPRQDAMPRNRQDGAFTEPQVTEFGVGVAKLGDTPSMDAQAPVIVVASPSTPADTSEVAWLSGGVSRFFGKSAILAVAFFATLYFAGRETSQPWEMDERKRKPMQS